jgi:hypothetical protein
LFFALIALYFVLQNSRLPSLDGPAHMYNSFLLKEYFLGNNEVRNMYVLNKFYIPNLFSNYYLALLIAIFNTYLGAKLFYFSLLFLLLLSAYYLLNSFKTMNAFVLSLAFVTIYNSFLLNIGFYNFTFSIVFLFFAIGYYFRSECFSAKSSNVNYVIYTLIIGALYYSNGLSFVFYIVFVVSNFTFKAVSSILKNKELNKVSMMNSIIYLSLTIPFILMFIQFQSEANLSNQLVKTNLSELFKNLIEFTSFIAYSREAEVIFTICFSICTAILFLICLYNRLIKSRFKFQRGDSMLLFAIVFFVLYLFIPDNYSAGMMSPRFQFYFYIFIIVWLFIQNNKLSSLFLALIFFISSVYKYQVCHKQILSGLNDNAKQIIAAEKYIEENKTVVSFNYSGNWVESHFSNYLGLKKPILVLDNYEASVGWFPLKWNKDLMPCYKVAGNISFENFYWNPSNKTIAKEVEYIFMYCGNHLSKENIKLQELLNNYERIDKGEFHLISIYRRK